MNPKNGIADSVVEQRMTEINVRLIAALNLLTL